MACKYGDKRRDNALYMKDVSDESLLERRKTHEFERTRMKGVGSIAYGGRLIWMQAVRREIANRRIDD